MFGASGNPRPFPAVCARVNNRRNAHSPVTVVGQSCLGERRLLSVTNAHSCPMMLFDSQSESGTARSPPVARYFHNTCSVSGHGHGPPLRGQPHIYPLSKKRVGAVSHGSLWPIAASNYRTRSARCQTVKPAECRRRAQMRQDLDYVSVRDAIRNKRPRDRGHFIKFLTVCQKVLPVRWRHIDHACITRTR